MSRIFLVFGGIGPSSKVSTTSRSLSGSVSGYCMVPMRGSSAGSTVMVRLVPIALGLPLHSAADAFVCAAVSVSRKAAATGRIIEA